MPPKKSNYKKPRKVKRGGKPRTHVPKFAKQDVANFVKNQAVITKKHLFPGYNGIRPFGSDTHDNGVVNNQQWKLFTPLNMSKQVGETPANDWGDRESSKIYAKNTTFKMRVTPSTDFLEPFYVRILAGYFKGDDNVGTQGLTAASMKVLYPEIDSGKYTRNTGQRDFYWKYDKTRLVCAKQIYDSNGSDNATTAMGQVEAAEPMKALICPFNMDYNFIHNRVHSYEEHDGDSLQGWTPIIAVQCMPLQGNGEFTRKTLEGDLTAPGLRPGPVLDVVMTTYFNDCH